MSRTALKLTAATALLAGGLGLAACTDSGSDTASAESTRAAGITDGKRPQSHATRQEVAIMVRKALEGRG